MKWTEVGVRKVESPDSADTLLRDVDGAAPKGSWSKAALILFIAAQIGVPFIATLHRWLTGKESWWGWQMFSS